MRNHAVAVYPVGRLLPLMGAFIARLLAYPTVPGSDVAGEVLAVGSAVTQSEAGDVLGHAAFLEKMPQPPSSARWPSLFIKNVMGKILANQPP